MGLAVTIRLAAEHDGRAVAALLAQLEHPSRIAYVGRRIRCFSQTAAFRVWVAEAQEQVAGFLALSVTQGFHEAPPTARILALCVAEAFRSRQIGRRLVEHAAAYAGRSGCRGLEVTSHMRRTRAHDFYRRTGFIETHRYFFRPLEEATPSDPD